MNHYFTHFDRLFQELDWGLGNPQPSQAKETCRMPKYPVSNCYLAEDQNSLHFEFALAGYEEKEIKVIGGKNSFTIRASKESAEDVYVLHKGISDKAVDFSINVDEQYDTKKAKVSYKNGLLSVTIPKAKEAESVMLFG